MKAGNYKAERVFATGFSGFESAPETLDIEITKQGEECIAKAQEFMKLNPEAKGIQIDAGYIVDATQYEQLVEANRVGLEYLLVTNCSVWYTAYCKYDSSNYCEYELGELNA